MGFALDHGRVTMADAVKLTEANRNTLKQHFSESGGAGVFATVREWARGLVWVGVRVG